MTVDFKKSLDMYRAPPGQFRIVEVPDLAYLMVDGDGDPNTSSEYTDALAALYQVAYKLKFFSKKSLGKDYVVPPLEALWWAADMASFTTKRDKSAWSWTAMLMVPEWLGEDEVQDAVEVVRARGKATSIEKVRLEVRQEKLCVQTLHVGPYEDEGPLLERMHHEFIPNAGLRLTGKHHEIYLNDVRRVAAEKLRTVLRQPVEKV